MTKSPEQKNFITGFKRAFQRLLLDPEKHIAHEAHNAATEQGVSLEFFLAQLSPEEQAEFWLLQHQLAQRSM